MEWAQFNELFGLGSNILQYLTAVPAIGAFFYTMAINHRQKEEVRRMKEMVNIQLRLDGEGDREIVLPFEIMRGEISRAEILGLLGMVPMVAELKGKRFAIDYLSKPAFLKQVYGLKAGDGFTLVIPCTELELDQFAL